MRLELNTPAAREPVTLDEMREQARVVGNELDNLIQRAIITSREHVEAISNRTLISKTYTLYLDVFADVMRLPLAPLQSVTQITYTDTDGNSQVLDTGIYEVDAISDPGFVRLGYQQVWPTTRDYPDAVRIQFVAGYGDGPESVPAGAIQMIMSHATMLVDNPSMLDYGQNVREVPQVFDRVLANIRNWLG